MKRLMVMTIFLFGLLYVGFSLTSCSDLAYASDANNLAAELKKIKKKQIQYKNLKSIYMTIDLACSELTKKSGGDKSALLDEIVLLYGRVAKVDQTHHGHELIAPYYQKNPQKVKKAARRLLSIGGAREFLIRIEMTIREDEEGNG